eukprot:629017-Pyramimonas_sp.AAC.1
MEATRLTVEAVALPSSPSYWLMGATPLLRPLTFLLFYQCLLRLYCEACGLDDHQSSLVSLDDHQFSLLIVMINMFNRN